MIQTKFEEALNSKDMKNYLICKSYYISNKLLIEAIIMEYKFEADSIGQISDGYHTFDELYYHRMVLFSVICNTFKEHSWKSWHHADGTMYEDYFIVGVTTPEGEYTYHYHKDHWDMFQVPEIEKGHEWDGHQPGDIGRLCSLLKESRN